MRVAWGIGYRGGFPGRSITVFKAAEKARKAKIWCICVEKSQTSMKTNVNDHLAGWFVYTFWDCLASQLLGFAFMEVVLHNDFSRLEIKPSVFISKCHTDSDKVNCFIELSAGRSASNFLQAVGT